MIRLFANANYDFIKWRRWAYGLTAAIIIPGFALFLVRGLNYSIEFTGGTQLQVDRKSTRLNSSHDQISYAVFCLKKKKKNKIANYIRLVAIERHDNSTYNDI